MAPIRMWSGVEGIGRTTVALAMALGVASPARGAGLGADVRGCLGNYGLRVEFRRCLSFSFYHRVHSFDGQMNLHKLL